MGFVLIFMGFILATLGILVALVSVKGGAEVEGGGIIMIGPVPLILGRGSRWILPALIIAVVLTLLSLLFHLR